MKNQITLASAPAEVPHPAPQSITDWGIAIAVMAIVGRELWNLLKHKDQAEAVLTTQLIDDLRGSNQRLLQQNADAIDRLVVIFDQQAESLKGTRQLLHEIRVENSTNRRDVAAIIMELRALGENLGQLQQKVEVNSQSIVGLAGAPRAA